MGSLLVLSRRLVAMLALACLSAAPAAAQAINYRFTGNGSGSLNGTNFTNTNFSFSINGFVQNVEFMPPSTFQITDLAAQFSITGVGSGVLPGVHVFSNQSTNPDLNGIGFGDQDLHDLLDLFPIVPANAIDLKSSFGPVTRTGSNLFFSQFTGIETTAGTLSFTDITTATFVATVAPEPSTFVLLTAGFVVVGVITRRRKAAATS